MSISINERVWFITGANSGFGLRLVSSALSRGDRVIASARSLDKIPKEFSKLNGQQNPHFHLIQLDVTECEETIQQKVNEAISVWGRVDVLVNNAGFALFSLLEEAGAVGAMKQFATNYFGVVNVTNAILPHMRERKSGSIIIMGSRSGWKADIPHVGHYAASKAAVHAYGETLAVELASFSIRVLIVEPGLFRTEGIHASGHYSPNPIADYDSLRGQVLHRTETLGKRRTEIGDPRKAMDLLVDIVRGEGRVVGKEWPLILVLGEDADKDVRASCRRIEGLLDEWKEVTWDTRLVE
ncbi:hypothetical protein JAAARDRAFT_32738 [Jaapia argillacea MUCL 33604]|uniref:NAD(P)-binding protein n=1 Tax=Jaapia argillacea MUCL 33604 TaxID=933084 RepID=A0A067Q037_9AGAM|nr:hypothetical protein JAAARDRAFT_32738 [Jaapia argillacea MUCL 33604]